MGAIYTGFQMVGYLCAALGAGIILVGSILAAIWWLDRRAARMEEKHDR